MKENRRPSRWSLVVGRWQKPFAYHELPRRGIAQETSSPANPAPTTDDQRPMRCRHPCPANDQGPTTNDSLFPTTETKRPRAGFPDAGLVSLTTTCLRYLVMKAEQSPVPEP